MQVTPLTEALELLRRADVRVIEGGVNELTIRTPDRQFRRVLVKRFVHAPLIEAASASTPILQIAQNARDTFISSAIEQGQDLIVLSPPVVVIAGKLLLDERGSSPASRRPHRGPRPWGRWAAMRVVILAQKRLTQSALAEAIGMGQQSVSKILKGLSEYINYGNGGYAARNKGELFELWLVEYPGPGGASSYWYSLDSPREQAKEAYEMAKSLEISTLVSGDVAADDLAPWRIPSLASIYLSEFVDFTGRNFSPATQGGATLEATVPEDPTLWFVAQWHNWETMPGAQILHAAATPPNGALHLADPLIVLFDLYNGYGPDAADAANHLRTHLIGP